MEFEKSSIERLKRTLYSRNEDIVPKEKRTPVSGKDTDVPTNWGTTSSFDVLNNNMTRPQKNNSFFNKFLIGSFIFFLVALGVALFIFFGGLNMISSDNLDIKIMAPSSVSSGEELVMGLSIMNSNRTDLEQVTLFVDYPNGAVSVGENKPLSRQKIDLGTISSGSSKDHTARAILSGEKEAIKSFNFRIEYKVAGSNAVFSKEKIYDIIISSSPIILNVSYPKEINSGQEVTISIDVISNTNVVTKNTLVKVEYPYGFTYKDSNIKPLQNSSTQVGGSTWNIGDLKNGDRKTLSVRGVLVGQNLEDRTFNISAGTQKQEAVTDFDVALATGIATIGIRKSSFNLEIISQPVAVMGNQTPITIKWQNILPDKILNTLITATISGEIFDRASVKTNDGGFYKSINNTIVWDKNTTGTLASISPGDSGDVSFSIDSFADSIQTRLIKNPHIDIAIKIVGDRSGTDSGEVSSDENILIKFPSVLTFTARSFRNIGPFSNAGPIPPQADKESTYTITWTITNTNNDLKDTIVTAVLPTGVDWKGEISPLGERLVFDSEARILSWDIGNVSLGTGFTYSAKEVSFKVGITPSLNQVGSVPSLLTNLKAEAIDTYTETKVVSQSNSVNTLYSDPSYNSGDNVVVK